MRVKFTPQMTIGMIPIEEIEFDVFSRHELAPILMALQYLYVHHMDVVTEICELIENDVCGTSDVRNGRNGLSAWEILVLASCRLGSNLDYDQLSDLATNHRKIRQMMELDDFDQKRYPKSTINDNLTQLSPETIVAISDMVVNQGHHFFPDALNRVRGDSYVLQTNIHYPTDINLIHDGVRKVISLSEKLAGNYGLKGWRQHQHHTKNSRDLKREIQRIARSRKKNREDELKRAYTGYIENAQTMVDRSLETIHRFNSVKNQASIIIQQKSQSIADELQHFIGGIEYVSELAYRRVIEDEEIPNDEKTFSLFESGTQLINRGKRPNPIEFGHRVLIIQDNAGFIIHASVMGRGITDEKILISVMKNLQKRYNGKIRATSFDKGFWKKENLSELSKIVELPVLPKKGRHSESDREREGSKEFGRVRKWHSGVESAIHALVAGNGLGVCRDKGPDGYDRYFALGILGRNLQTLGMILLEKEREKKRKEMLFDLIAA